MTGVPAPAGHARGTSQAGVSPHADPAKVHTASQTVNRQAGPSSQFVVGHGGQHPHIAASQSTLPHNATTSDTNDDSDSDSGIEGAWNKFLDKICFPCGHYYDT